MMMVQHRTAKVPEFGDPFVAGKSGGGIAVYIVWVSALFENTVVAELINASKYLGRQFLPQKIPERNLFLEVPSSSLMTRWCLTALAFESPLRFHSGRLISQYRRGWPWQLDTFTIFHHTWTMNDYDFILRFSLGPGHWLDDQPVRSTTLAPSPVVSEVPIARCRAHYGCRVLRSCALWRLRRSLS